MGFNIVNKKLCTTITKKHIHPEKGVSTFLSQPVTANAKQKPIIVNKPLASESF